MLIPDEEKNIVCNIVKKFMKVFNFYKKDTSLLNIL